jgi:hypothetical protein
MRWCFFSIFHVVVCIVCALGAFSLDDEAPKDKLSAGLLQRLDVVNERFTQLESSVQQLIGKLSNQKQRQQFEYEDESSESSWWSSFSWVHVLFVHEVWIMLQHLNVLCNPLCQRLDRRYGIALLKRKLYWVIAGMQSLHFSVQQFAQRYTSFCLLTFCCRPLRTTGVLGLYWGREIVSMIAAFRFASLITQRMVMVSCGYHAAKITLVTVDARRRYSPRFGIMRLLMDHWHLKSALDVFVSIKRFSLQVYIKDNY